MIKVSLPKPNDTSGSQGIRHFLKQMELSIHHLQKSLEQMEKDSLVNEDTYIIYRFPKINLYDREQDSEGNVKVHVDEESDQMQEIEIEIENV